METDLCVCSCLVCVLFLCVLYLFSHANNEENNSEHGKYLTCVPFDMIVLFMILINAVLIVVDQAYENERVQEYNSNLRANGAGGSGAGGSGSVVGVTSTIAALNVLESIFMGLFTLEAILRLFALRCKRYLLDLWNTFDLIIVIMGWAALMGSSSR